MRCYRGKSWGQSVATAWSQFWNAIFLGNPDQSFSSRSYEAMSLGRPGWRFAVRVIDLLFRLVLRQRDHCLLSFNSDNERTYTE